MGEANTGPFAEKSPQALAGGGMLWTDSPVRAGFCTPCAITKIAEIKTLQETLSHIPISTPQTPNRAMNSHQLYSWNPRSVQVIYDPALLSLVVDLRRGKRDLDLPLLGAGLVWN